jgi:hypothetical protein
MCLVYVDCEKNPKIQLENTTMKPEININAFAEE